MLNAQCPMLNALGSMPNAQCPMPNAQCSMPNAQCPMLNAQCPMFNAHRRAGEPPRYSAFSLGIGDWELRIFSVLIRIKGGRVRPCSLNRSRSHSAEFLVFRENV